MKSFLLFFTLLCFIGCTKSSGPSADNNVDSTGNPADSTHSLPADVIAKGWTKINLPDSGSFSDIIFADNQLGFVNSYDDLYKSIDGGLSWKKIYHKDQGDIFSLGVTPDGNLFAASILDNLIYKSLNGGPLKTQFIDSISERHGIDIRFTGNDTGYITDGCSRSGSAGLWQTVDGGYTWSLIPISGYTSGSASYLSVNQHAGFCISGPSIYHSNITKDKWTAAAITPAETCASVAAVNANVAYVGGFSGSIYKTNDGGISFYKVGALPDNMQKGFLDMAFLDEQNGYAIQQHKLYKTIDGGKTWTTEITLSWGVFTKIYFTDARHGWACGVFGDIFVFRG